MIHIVFNQLDVQVLENVILLDETLKGEIIQIKDDFAVGPINSIFETEGIEYRREWWKQVLAGGDLDGKTETDEVNDEKTFNQIINKLEENKEEQLWIWCAQNKHDVSGYYWLISRLKNYQGRIFILYLNNLPFINEKGHIFYPEWLHQIRPEEFLKAKKLARLITLSEFEIDPDEWLKLCAENKYIRLLEGGKKLQQVDFDYYDAELISFITKDFQKASKIISQYLSKSKNQTGDMFLLWRLKSIIAKEEFEIQGAVGKMKDFEIRHRVF